MSEQNRTRIHRDVKKTLTSMLGALVCLSLAYWLIANSNSRAPILSYLFAAIAAIPGLILFYRGLAMTGVGECPSCRSLEAKLVEERDGPMGRNVAVGVASLGVLKTVERQTHRIAVPHCEEHSDGAVLQSAVDSDMLSPAIAFRSHGYLKRFCQLNGTQPRR